MVRTWQDTDVWFTAGHRLGTPGTYVDTVLEPHNARVEPGDLVWHLGGLTAPGHLNLARGMTGNITAISAPGDETFVDAQGLGAADAAERLRKLSPNVKHVVTGRAFRKSRIPIVIPLGFGFDSISLWCLPYSGGMDTAPWRPPIPSKGERRWLLHAENRSAVNPVAREISVHRDAWDGRPVHIDEIREIIRKLS
jgi:hypothetical protein